MRILLLTLVLFISSEKAHAQKAPEILVNKWVTKKYSKSIAYENNLVIIDFWFINCAPCNYSIPHLNDLADEFPQVVFLAITFDPVDKVESFLLHKAINAQVGIDTSRALISAFGVESYPTTFIIKDGVIIWQGSPMTLNSDMVRFAKNGGVYPKTGNQINTLREKKYENNDFIFNITPNNYLNKSAGVNRSQNEITLVNMNLASIISLLHKTSAVRVIVPDSISNRTFDMRFKSKNRIASIKNFKDLLSSLIADKTSLGYTSKTESREGYSISIIEGSIFNKHFDTTKIVKHSGTMITKNEWKGNNIQIDNLVLALENHFNVFFFNDLKLKGTFKEIAFPLSNIDSASEYLSKHYGLRFSRVKRKTKLIILK